jgi:hypothetical protein
MQRNITAKHEHAGGCLTPETDGASRFDDRAASSVVGSRLIANLDFNLAADAFDLTKELVVGNLHRWLLRL